LKLARPSGSSISHVGLGDMYFIYEQ